jgi:hypothetical protein
MRSAGAAALALVLALGLAPVAGAHHEASEGGEVTHRDTPAELAGADIARALTRAQLTSRTSAALPEYLPTTWCGTRRTDDDTANAAFASTAAQIKVVYAYALNETDRSAAWTDSLQADVSRIEQFLALQSGGRRALRFDMGTNCGPQYVDVQVVPLPRTRSAYLAFNADDRFDEVNGDVNAALAPAAGPRNVFVLADGLSTSGVYGIGQVYPNADQPPASYIHDQGDLTGMMFVTQGTSPDPVGWQPTVMLHEMSHNLGAVQFAAPRSTSYAHCIDGEDVMCYEDGSPEGSFYADNVCPLAGGAISQTYDCGHNDYYDPSPTPSGYLATHWNVYNSAFMGSCKQLGMACGDAIVPSPPVNTDVPTVSGVTRPGAVLTASAGAWLNSPTSFLIQWQRAVGGDWATIPGAVGPSYLAVPADAGAALRVVVTATNEDGSAIVASAPTAPLAVPAPAPTVAGRIRLGILLRDHARHAKGTLAARVVPVAAGREVRTDAVKLAVTPGTWRLRLCAGPSTGRLRCALSKRVRTRKRSVRLPATKVLVRSPTGALKVTAALVDKRSRIRAQGSAASA